MNQLINDILNKQKKDKEFSDERMQKSISVEHSFRTFVDRCHNYCNNNSSSNELTAKRRLNLNESDVLSRLSEASERVHLALCDDFNTAQAVDELQALVKHMNSLMDDRGHSSLSVNDDDASFNRHYGCVTSVGNYVRAMLQLFGIEFTSSTDASSSNGDAIRVDKLIEASLRLRKSVRMLASDKRLPNEIRTQIFKSCDNLRDDFKLANIELKVSNQISNSNFEFLLKSLLFKGLKR